MNASQTGVSCESRIRTIIPPLAGWDTYAGAVANILVFGLVLLAGEWLVHQIVYLIEYGSNVGTVMATTPHRFYMGPLGLTFAVLVGSSAASGFALMCRAHRVRRRITQLLPERLHRLLPVAAPSLAPRAVAATALTLAFCQTVLYTVQENLESAAVGLGWPGGWVLFGPHHYTVLPLQLLLAACTSVLLWTAAGRLRGSLHAAQLARLLLRSFPPRNDAPPRLAPQPGHIPNLRHVAGMLGLRSPPLIA